MSGLGHWLASKSSINFPTLKSLRLGAHTGPLAIPPIFFSPPYSKLRSLWPSSHKVHNYMKDDGARLVSLQCSQKPSEHGGQCLCTVYHQRNYAIMTPPFEFVASTTHIFVIDLLTAEIAPIPRYDWSRDNKEPTIIFDHASFRTFVASNSSFNLERLVSLKVSKNDAWPPVRLFRGSDRQSEGKKCSFLFFLRKRSCML